ncbi:MAG: VOC family protein [Alphaproteobacteria bacterium]|nr:VOC family protein [Alphaproteobacteria bacterium]
MKLGYTIIYVSDVLATVEFYQRAFSIKLKFLHESNLYGEMETGETTLAFVSEALAQMNDLQIRPNRVHDVPSGFEIAFVTNDVDRAFEIAIKEGAKPISSPAKKPWGQIVAYVSDVNGVLVEICEPMNT